MFLMLNKINNFVMAFTYPNQYLLTLKIKDKKYSERNCILHNFIKRENKNYKGIFVDRGSGSVFFPDPDPGDPKRPGPTRSGSRSATLI